ncbi:PC-Esterase [Dillenia turbinata]|uniref:PC-Esterase n=1 Tax=Dillenia turbinata TaxID=194707 RepID=A0AAN8V1W1_9MAGN
MALLLSLQFRKHIIKTQENPSIVKPDSDYLKLQWKPYGCEIPRFYGKRMLEILRGKRLVFVGDSLNRNMWESLVCALREALITKNGVFEISRRRGFKTQGFYSFIFREHNCTIDFFTLPFLVQEWKAMARGGGTQEERETLRLDLIKALLQSIMMLILSSSTPVIGGLTKKPQKAISSRKVTMSMAD